MIAFRRPPWWALLLTVAGALLFTRLGVWQLHRADFKDALLRRYAASASAPVQDFANVAATPPSDAFPRVQVRGHYLIDRFYLLDNPKHDGRGGVEVYVPFAARGQARLLLVDLGFLPGNGTRKTPSLPLLSAAEVALKGLYVPPPPVGFEMGGDALRLQKQWPKDTIFIDPAEISRDLGHALLPRVLALDDDPASIYVREHKLDLSAMTPARHRAYAFQWFSFALAAVVILLVLNRRRTPRRSRHPNDDEVR
ncbi:MAG: SURF1 family protein [Rhodanobacter sp.]